MMKITLKEWGMRHYSPPPSMHVLRSWASTGQLPGIEKVGACYMLDEHTVRIPVAIQRITGDVSPRVQQILKAA